MSQISANLGAVESNAAQLRALAQRAEQVGQAAIGSFNKMASDGSGATVAAGQDFAQHVKGLTAAIQQAAEMTAKVSVNTASSAVGIDKSSAAAMGV